MISWIVTGGVACGKSAVSEALMRHVGAGRSFSSDECVARLLEQSEVKSRLVESFGSNVLVGEGGGSASINRAVLREIAFNDISARRQLEAIIHPLVLAELESSRAEALKMGEQLFLAEVPLYYEIGGTVEADLVIVAVASRTIQTRRLMERRGLDESIIERILRSQWPIEAKIDRADVVIWNDGDLSALEMQVLTLARHLRLA